MLTAVVEQLCLMRHPDQLPRKASRLDAAAFVQLAEMRNRLLDNALADPHAAHQPPIAVNLAALANRRMPQIHAANQI